MKSFAASADEKLEKCGKRIRDLDVKVSLLESKLDSIDELEKKEAN